MILLFSEADLKKYNTFIKFKTSQSKFKYSPNDFLNPSEVYDIAVAFSISI